MIPVVTRAGAVAGPPSVTRVCRTPSGQLSEASHSPDTTGCGTHRRVRAADEEDRPRPAGRRWPTALAEVQVKEPRHLGQEGIARPGDAAIRQLVRPRPGQQLPGRLQVSRHAQRGRAVAVPPAGADQHGAHDPAVVGPQRAVAPVGAVVLLADPVHQPRGRAPRSGAARCGRTPRRGGRAAAARSSRSSPWGSRAGCSRSAPRRGSACRRCSGRPSRRRVRSPAAPADVGRRAGCSVNPPYDTPHEATAPVHHGCCAIQATTSQPSSCSASVYSSCATPCELPVPRTSRRTQANPAFTRNVLCDRSSIARRSSLR